MTIEEVVDYAHFIGAELNGELGKIGIYAQVNETFGNFFAFYIDTMYRTKDGGNLFQHKQFRVEGGVDNEILRERLKAVYHEILCEYFVFSKETYLNCRCEYCGREFTPKQNESENFCNEYCERNAYV